MPLALFNPIDLNRLPTPYGYDEAHGGVRGVGFWRYDMTTELILSMNEDRIWKTEYS